MPQMCCAIGCSNEKVKGSEKGFFRIPTEPDRRWQWIAAINRKNWTPTEYTRICSDHFITGT